MGCKCESTYPNLSQCCDTFSARSRAIFFFFAISMLNIVDIYVLYFLCNLFIHRDMYGKSVN